MMLPALNHESSPVIFQDKPCPEVVPGSLCHAKQDKRVWPTLWHGERAIRQVAQRVEVSDMGQIAWGSSPGTSVWMCYDQVPYGT
jgi:hypothetical protein